MTVQLIMDLLVVVVPEAAIAGRVAGASLCNRNGFVYDSSELLTILRNHSSNMSCTACHGIIEHDGVDQSRFGRPPSRPVGTDKDVKYEERPCGREASL